MQTKIIGTVVAVILLGGAFWAGMSYGKSQSATPAGTQFGAGNFSSGGAGGFGGGTGGNAGGMRMGRSGGGFATGQVVASDANSVTIKLASGSTQIVLVGTSTQVLKSTLGNISDLAAGTNVTVMGATNSDGSLTAQSIQIRPAGMSGRGQAPAAVPAQ